MIIMATDLITIAGASVGSFVAADYFFGVGSNYSERNRQSQAMRLVAACCYTLFGSLVGGAAAHIIHQSCSN